MVVVYPVGRDGCCQSAVSGREPGAAQNSLGIVSVATKNHAWIETPRCASGIDIGLQVTETTEQGNGMQTTQCNKSVWPFVAALALTACGGGGDSGVVNKPEGVYSGTLSGGASSAFQLLVLENDEYWAMYGTSLPGAFLVAGFIQGQGTSTNTTFTSSNARDFGLVPALAGTVSASYVVNASIAGTIASPGGSVSFSGAPIVGTAYDYNAAANLGAITGSWNLTALDGSAVNLVIAGNGAVTGSNLGCAFTGTIAPRPSGKNVFNVSVTFGGAPCAVPGQTATGVALTYLLAGGVARQLVVAGVDAARTTGTALFGTR